MVDVTILMSSGRVVGGSIEPVDFDDMRFGKFRSKFLEVQGSDCSFLVNVNHMSSMKYDSGA